MSQPTDQPNILLIISDDHGYGDLSFHQHDPQVKTPNLDRLARTGRFYQQAYVSAPVCSPSRAGLITGSHQQRWGALWFDSANFAPAEYPTIAQVLKQAGYRTGYFGKVHYGSQDNYGSYSCPDQHGFDQSFYGLAALSMGRLHYQRHSQQWVQRYGETAAQVHGVHPMVHNGKQVDCDNHLTLEFAVRARRFMAASSNASASGEAFQCPVAGETACGSSSGQVSQPSSQACYPSDQVLPRPLSDSAPQPGGPKAQSQQPFFCMLAFNAVHNFTWQLPQYQLDAHGLPQHPDFDPQASAYVDWYDGCVSPNLKHGREYYLAQLELMDKEIGRTLDFLAETGQDRNTLVVYLTDNGGSKCNYGENWPLTGGKYSLYEGGVRVPMIVSWPGRIPAGSRSDALVSALDLLPTFAAVAGVDLPRPDLVDGQDLSANFVTDAPVHSRLHFACRDQWAVRDQDWKLRWVDPESPLRTQLRQVEHTQIGAGWSLVKLTDSLDESPAANQIQHYPQVARDLLAAQQRWCEKVGLPAPSNTEFL